MKETAALVVWSGEPGLADSLALLAKDAQIDKLAVLSRLDQQAQPDATEKADAIKDRFKDLDWLQADRRWSQDSLDMALRWFHDSGAQHFLLLHAADVRLESEGLRRMLRAANETGSLWLYSDYHEIDDDKLRLHPLIDYQNGSLRDDFDFGPVQLLARDSALLAWSDQRAEQQGLRFGALYDLRLRISEQGKIFHLPEACYLHQPGDQRRSGQKVFDYVDPRQRDYQIEMEQIATRHLRRIDAWLAPVQRRISAQAQDFARVASVVIPVRDRAKTIAEAVASALRQKTDFDFNVIVVDNHSTDGSGDILHKLAQQDARLLHMVPARRDLGIGGCWNEAIYSEACGEYALQLDSDDLYAADDVLQRIVDQMRQDQSALAVGAYTTVDFDLQEQAPGLIDHREWSADNGHNNLLRIHGMGAPRAYHVPSLRPFGFPNVSYGEDYAVVLRLSRQYKVSRIYDNLYWCRRWSGNTDSNLDINTQNRYHFYKDCLRSMEICARRRMQTEDEA